MSSFQETISNKPEVSFDLLTSKGPFEFGGKTVYTVNQALNLIGYSGENARNQLQQDIFKGKVLKVGEARKPGSFVVISLLDAETVEKRAEAYAPRTEKAEGHAYEIRVTPELLQKFIKTDAKVMSEELVEEIQRVLTFCKDLTKARTEYHRAHRQAKNGK